MCGIAGAVGRGYTSTVVNQMCNEMKYRGPDNTGIWSDDEFCTLGHNRLSIIDLSDAANQPYVSNNQRYVLVYNGEIYNYVELRNELGSANFHTTSDTEVLMHAYSKWGSEMLHRLNGMFAFAIWDKVEKKLFAARDRFGVKPLYYALKNDVLYFSSEIPPLFKAGIAKSPNLKVWSSYFVSGKYAEGDETFWEGINSLEPSSSFIFEDGKITLKKWYDFESIIKEQRNNSLDHKEIIKSLLLDSTRLRFRADVPVGFNLSGGLDSSMLFSLINAQFGEDSNIEAFSFYTGDPSYDEIEYVESLLEGSNFKLNRVLLSPEEVPGMAAEMALQQMEPFGGLPTIAYSKLFKVASEKGFKVLLDGQGADEAWAGYDYYFNDSNFTLQGVQSSPFRPNVLLEEFVNEANKKVTHAPFEENLLNLQYRDLFYTKLPRALRFSDRVSMQSSTELREPFLDYRLVEKVFSLPQELKMRDGISKWLFRDIAEDFLTNNIRLAPKRPLQTPQREWFGNELKEWVFDECLSLHNIPWFNMQEVQKELDLYIKGEKDSSFHLWQWVNTGLIFNSGNS